MDGVKSKARVKDLGEVYTPDSIVLDMLNGVNEQLSKRGLTNREIACSTYLEPTCGNGQFLIRLIKDKIDRVETEWKEKELSADEIKKLLIRAISTVYGIDIDSQNVIDSKIRLMKLIFGDGVFTFDITSNKENTTIKDRYPLVSLSQDMQNFIKTLTESEKQSIKNILHNNIIVGNMLDMWGTSIVTYTWSEDNSTVEIGSVLLVEVQMAQESGKDTEEEKELFKFNSIPQHSNIKAIYENSREIGGKIPELYTDRIENWKTEEDYYRALYEEAINSPAKEIKTEKSKPTPKKRAKTTGVQSSSNFF